ncbi:MAG TPA: response regulator [Flavisolibacter sp.]|nr:response regulator [Flavisolibacter sp.]
MKNKLNCILLVDDDEPTNFLNQIVIEELNITEQIRVAQNGQEALAYLKQTGSGDEDFPLPDLILLDINMPAMNGWEFLERYSHLPAHQKANVVIVMLTTSLNPDDRAKAHEISEVTGFETKPLTVDKLQALLEKYFPEVLA